VLYRVAPVPPGAIMVARSTILRNAEGAQSESRAGRGPQSAGKDSIKAGARKPRPKGGW
jgi:hypothetical protein